MSPFFADYGSTVNGIEASVRSHMSARVPLFPPSAPQLNPECLHRRRPAFSGSSWCARNRCEGLVVEMKLARLLC
jgi:hypothetical protein